MFFIRADSNQEIASGHIARCITIAKYIKKIGEKVIFLIADANPISMLEDADMEYRVLNSDWTDLMTDSELVIQILEKENNPILLVDTYSVSREYVEKLAPFCRIAYLGSKKEFLGPLQVLINYSTNIDYYFYEKEYLNKTKLLLGPSFAPLREEFQNFTRNYKKQVKRILITTGNTDPYNMVGELINLLTPVINEKNIILDIVVGRMFTNKEELRKLGESSNNIYINENVRDMSTIMKRCDMAISANGTTVYELAAMGVPIISFALVDEQVGSAEALSENGVLCYCGNSFQEKELVCEKIVKQVKYYLENNMELIRMAGIAKGLIDGDGCKRIVQELI